MRGKGGLIDALQNDEEGPHDSCARKAAAPNTENKKFSTLKFFPPLSFNVPRNGKIRVKK
jgi:hypothetical protein